MFTRIFISVLLLMTVVALFAPTSLSGKGVQTQVLAQALRESGKKAPRLLRNMLAHDEFRAALADYNGILTSAVTSRVIPSLSLPRELRAALYAANTTEHLDRLTAKLRVATHPRSKVIDITTPVQLLQAGVFGILLALPLTAAAANTGDVAAVSGDVRETTGQEETQADAGTEKTVSATEEVFREFTNGVYAYHTNYDIASQRSSLLTLGFYTEYETSTSTSEGSLGGWFNSTMWENLPTSNNAGEWWGYNDYGMRLKISKGAKVPGSSGALIPLIHFENGGSYYKFYKLSADVSSGIGFRLRTRVFKSRKKVKLMANVGLGGLVFNPYDSDSGGYRNEHWRFAGTYGLQFETDSITIADVLGIEKPSVFALIPLLPALKGDYREFRPWKNFGKFYRMLRADIRATDFTGLRGEYRKRQGEDSYLRFSVYLTLYNVF